MIDDSNRQIPFTEEYQKAVIPISIFATQRYYISSIDLMNPTALVCGLASFFYHYVYLTDSSPTTFVPLNSVSYD